MTRSCLEVLRPTLGVDDEVIVVDNGSTDQTLEGLRHYRWVKVVENKTNRGFAGGCNDGAAIATREVLVFLNNDTLPVGNWLDNLLVPFNDPKVGATGPRSNFVSGEQLVPEVSYSKDRTAGLKVFVREWEHDHEAMTSPLRRLVGFCLAVRRTVFETIGHFDERFGTGGYEDDDLCARIHDAGHELLVAHASFVHHHGHATFDANGLDWAAIENQNRELFLSKHDAGTGPVVLPQAGLALVIAETDDEYEAVGAALADLDWTVERIATTANINDELDARDPRPDLLVIAGIGYPLRQLNFADVPVIAWKCGVLLKPHIDLEAPAAVEPKLWMPAMLRRLLEVPTFGWSMLECRRHLEAGHLVEAIDAVTRAEKIRPLRPQAANAMAICAHVSGDAAQAQAFLKRALGLDATFNPARENLAALEVTA